MVINLRQGNIGSLHEQAYFFGLEKLKTDFVKFSGNVEDRF